jgi:ADP-dependent NAD(P)H-hydrate dehydratase / NAD(P)H-hydrate epimerase
MLKVVSNSEMREMDNTAIHSYGIPGIVLMENAGRNAAEIILDKCEELEIQTLLIFAGKGNNGGDGLVIARFLDNYGLNVIVYLLADEKEVTGDANTNLQICKNSHIEIRPLKNRNELYLPPMPFLIIDALLGTGVKGAVKGIYADVIDWINEQPAFVFAIDIPSGLSGDSAQLSGPAVMADATCTMGLPKTSMFFYPARSCCGDLQLVDIAFPAELKENSGGKIYAVDKDDIFFADPDPALHKHKAGRIFILGGSPGMTGAIVLAAKAASIAGSGMVFTGIAESLNPILENKLTEQLSWPLPGDGSGFLNDNALVLIKEKIDWCHAFLVGPGAGRNEKMLSLLKKSIEYALTQEKKIVIDADALFLFASDEQLLSSLNENCVITPHHGEFLRFNEAAKEQIMTQPWKVLQDFINKYNVITNLKGAPSVVGQKDKGLFINTSGNPGLAKGGSGDILAGLITGLCALGSSPLNAAVYANYIHGYAADNAADKWGLRSFSMENLLDEIKLVFKEFY